MKYSVEIKPTAAKELDFLPKKILARTMLAIDTLAVQPRPLGSKKLIGTKDRWRIRISDYRILYGIDDGNRIVTIFRVSHRKEAYR